MSIVPPITVVQPQVAQLECKFSGPLVVGSVVTVLDDLTTLPYNYNHKIVWVKSEEANYFLKSGDGSVITHWEKVGSRVVIENYNPELTYSAGTTVSYFNKLYTAIEEVPIETFPTSNSEYWQVITGATETKRFIFQNKSNILVYTEIRNPYFEIIIGTIVLDNEGNPELGPDGLIKLENKEIVDAYITQREDLENTSNGVPYEIIFEEDSEPILLTGAINVK